MTANADNSAGDSTRLDLFSTSQKICSYNAPFIGVIAGENSKIFQACCNHWDCPRCGEMRARHEYGRIVNGARLLDAEHTLYFYTFTCRGRDLSLDKAQRDYLLWTNRLLSTMRARCKVEGGYWCYAQVTERQKRGHPHSHLLMCWLPKDAQARTDANNKPYFYSQWFHKAHERAGLGSQSKVTPVGSAEATAKYIAKYLFKDANFTTMPKHWKRVRYSQNFPDVQIDETAIRDHYVTLTTPSDWRKLEVSGETFACEQMIVWQVASKHIRRAKQAW